MMSMDMMMHACIPMTSLDLGDLVIPVTCCGCCRQDCIGAIWKGTQIMESLPVAKDFFFSSLYEKKKRTMEQINHDYLRYYISI